MSGEIKFSNGSTMDVSSLYKVKNSVDLGKIAKKVENNGEKEDYVLFQKDNHKFLAVGRGDLRSVDPSMSFNLNGEEVKTEGKSYVVNHKNTTWERYTQKSENDLIWGSGITLGIVGAGITFVASKNIVGGLIGGAASLWLGCQGGSLVADHLLEKAKDNDGSVVAPTVKKLEQKGDLTLIK